MTGFMTYYQNVEFGRSDQDVLELTDLEKSGEQCLVMAKMENSK
jgi:hypothetical protein